MDRKELGIDCSHIPNDSGQLSIDFIVGLSIFLIAFIMVATMASGLLVGLQSKHIDYDAVAYRTAVMLTEDPGEPVMNVDSSIYPNGTDEQWEFVESGEKNFVKRFGLAVSKSTPRVISLKKSDSFMDTIFYSQKEYEDKLLFSNYPYHFNITIQKRGMNEPITVGDPYDKNPQYGYIRRVILVKEPNTIIIDLNEVLLTPGVKQVTVNISTSSLLFSSNGSTYRLDPFREDIKIKLEPIGSIAIDPIVGVSLVDISCNISEEDGGGLRFLTIDDDLFTMEVDGIQKLTPHDGFGDPNYPPSPPLNGILSSIETKIEAPYLIRSATDIDRPKISITYRFDPATVKQMSQYIEIDDVDYPGPNLVPGWMEVRVW